MGAFAVDLNDEVARLRHEIFPAYAYLARGHGRPKMQAVDAVYLGVCQSALVYHLPCTRPALFAGLEQQHDVAAQLAAVMRYPLGKKQQDRHVSVVTAAVHDAAVSRAEAQAVFLGVSHAVHIRAKRDSALCALGIENDLEARLGDRNELVRAAVFENGANVLVSFVKLKADLRYTVEVAAYFNAIVSHAEDLVAYLHIISP